MTWSTREAELEKAKREYDAPPCPNCGADADVDWLELSTAAGTVRFMPASLDCSASCYERNRLQGES